MKATAYAYHTYFTALILAIPLFAGCSKRFGDLTATGDAGALYRQHCASCHGMQGESREVNGKFIPSLRSGRAVADSDERLAQWIAEGGVGMPAYRDELSAEQMRDLVRFIRRDLQHRRNE